MTLSWALGKGKKPKDQRHRDIEKTKKIKYGFKPAGQAVNTPKADELPERKR